MSRSEGRLTVWVGREGDAGRRRLILREDTRAQSVATNLHRRASRGETQSRGGATGGRAGISVWVCASRSLSDLGEI